MPESANNPLSLAEILTTPANTLKLICELPFENFIEFRKEYNHTQKANQINDFLRAYSARELEGNSRTIREREQKYISDNPREMVCHFMLTDFGTKKCVREDYLHFLLTILNTHYYPRDQDLDKCLASLKITHAAMKKTITPDWETIQKIKSSNGFYINLTTAELDGKHTTPDGWVDLHNAGYFYADHAEFTQLNMQNAFCPNSSFTRTTFTNVLLTEANLSHAYMKSVKIKDSNLSHAILENVDLSDAQLDNVNFSHANLRGANLDVYLLNSICDFSYADLTNAKIYHIHNLDKFKLTGTKLIGAQLFNPANFLNGFYEQKKVLEIEFEGIYNRLNDHEELPMIRLAIASDLARIATLPKTHEEARHMKHALEILMHEPLFTGHAKEHFPLLHGLIHHHKTPSQEILATAITTLSEAMKELPSAHHHHTPGKP